MSEAEVGMHGAEGREGEGRGRIPCEGKGTGQDETIRWDTAKRRREGLETFQEDETRSLVSVTNSVQKKNARGPVRGSTHQERRKTSGRRKLNMVGHPYSSMICAASSRQSSDAKRDRRPFRVSDKVSYGLIKAEF